MNYNENGNANYNISDVIDTASARAPYYAAALKRIRYVSSTSVDTMGTSKDWVTYYNPARFDEWTLAESAAVLLHELDHLMRRHSERCGERNHKRFNKASDAEINQRLSGLPEGAIYPSTLGAPDGQSAETYYGIIGDDGDEEDDGKGQGQDDGQGDGNGDAASDGNGDGAGCGSAAGGPAREYEDGKGNAKVPNGDAADEIRKDAARSVLAGSGAGTEMREWAEAEIGLDRARWYAALAGVVSHTMAQHGAPTRWAWPGRREAADMGGAVLPRWTGQRPSCAVLIDTSSSITPEDLNMARAAAHFMGRVASVTYYGCDTMATRYGSTLPERLGGGGGTDLRRGITMAIADGAKAVIVITDTYTPWPDEQTPVPLIVGANAAAPAAGMNGGYGDYFRVPEWVTYIPIIE